MTSPSRRARERLPCDREKPKRRKSWNDGQYTILRTASFALKATDMQDDETITRNAYARILTGETRVQRASAAGNWMVGP